MAMSREVQWTLLALMLHKDVCHSFKESGIGVYLYLEGRRRDGEERRHVSAYRSTCYS